MTDTIAAIATPPGQGAISVLRLSGPKAISIADEVFRSRETVEKAPARMQLFGKIVDEAGIAVDEVLLTKFVAPQSYTGEDTVEISGHGGMLVTQTLLEVLLKAGARHAEGGEFTQRAFLNGKMDLTQAEAVMDVISAQTDLALRAANRQLSGRLGGQVEELRQDLISILAHVEAFIDFPDEDIDPETGDQLVKRVEGVGSKVEKLAATSDQGRILREGVRTVICGAPNVGKSSLMNVLLGFDRAIVSNTAGTTRDTIEEVINLRGIPLRLIDTAGMRESDDAIEREGISRTEAQIENAELILEVFDASLSPGQNAPPISVPGNASHLTILNKVDQAAPGDWPENAVKISCTENSGFEALSDRIAETLLGGGSSWGDLSVAVNARHKACLVEAVRFLQNAAEQLKAGESPEFVSVDLRSALDSIGQIIGKTDIEEILGEIFDTFCIGK